MVAARAQVLYDETDITIHVMPSSARFEMLMGAAPGSFEFTVVDRDQTMSFITGKEVRLRIDGVSIWGGYVTSVTRKFAFPAVDTTVPEDVSTRLWVLRGVDYNILFDKRVLRNPSDYYHQLPNFTGDTFDGALLREALDDSKYFDIDESFDVTSEVDDVAYPFDPEIPGVNPGGDPDRIGAWPTQGTPMRKIFEDFVQISGAVFYFNANKTLYYKALEDVEARWGFSDNPNNGSIDSDPGYQDVTIGPRSVDANEDGSVIVNDALIWGGSEWAGEAGGTVFARDTNTDSVDTHGRWQVGEVHFGERGYKRIDGVTARARAIVRGSPGADASGQLKGLLHPQWNISLTWFAHDVPRIAGVADHLMAGDIVHINLETFGIEQLLPLRSVIITFAGTTIPVGAYSPTVDEIAYVQFQGSFSLQPSDPYTLWRFLRRRGAGGLQAPITTVDGDNPSPYGAIFSGHPEPDTDGTTTVFDLPDDRGYITGTTNVYRNGVFLRRGIDYTESDPGEGEITLATAPGPTTWLWVVCNVT